MSRFQAHAAVRRTLAGVTMLVAIAAAAGPSARGQADDRNELLGEWCMDADDYPSAGLSHSLHCVVLNVDGSYATSTVSRTFVGSGSGTWGAPAQAPSGGRWTVRGNVLTAQSRDGSVTTFAMHRRRHPETGKAQLCLDYECYTATGRPDRVRPVEKGARTGQRHAACSSAAGPAPCPAQRPASASAPSRTNAGPR